MKKQNDLGFAEDSTVSDGWGFGDKVLKTTEKFINFCYTIFRKNLPKRKEISEISITFREILRKINQEARDNKKRAAIQRRAARGEQTFQDTLFVLKDPAMTFFSKFKFIKNYLKALLSSIHPFHILSSSPWPFGAASVGFLITSGLVLYMHTQYFGWYLFIVGISGTSIVMYLWWRDVFREAKCEKVHTPRVRLGLAFGVILFITSEAMLFFAFFWSFFYFSGFPSFDPEHVWPPKAVLENRHLGMATFNTLILLSSATTVTWAHYSTLGIKKNHLVEALCSTIFLACLFMCVQLYEYCTYLFCMSDGIYGSCFYILTGFHGFHVFLGTVGLSVSLNRLVKNNYTSTKHLGFEAAIWYWHFVDVVWLGVYLSVYWWGNS